MKDYLKVFKKCVLNVLKVFGEWCSDGLCSVNAVQCV